MTRPAVLMVLGSCASLQVGAALAARLFPVAGSSGATLLRLGLAAVILLAIARPAVRGWQRHQWKAAILLGVSLAGMNGFFYAAIARIPLGPAVTIEFLGPLVLAAVLSRRPRDLAWVLLAAAGVTTMGFVGGATALDPLGVAYVLAAAVFWALYILAGSKAGEAIPGNGGLAIALTLATLAILPLGLQGAAAAVSTPPLLLVALGTAILASVIPYSLEMAALRRLPRPVFGILLSLEPAVAALAGWLLLAQPLTWPILLAITVVITATIGSTLSATRTPPNEPATSVRSGEPATSVRSGEPATGPSREDTPGPSRGLTREVTAEAALEFASGAAPVARPAASGAAPASKAVSLPECGPVVPERRNAATVVARRKPADGNGRRPAGGPADNRPRPEKAEPVRQANLPRG